MTMYDVYDDATLGVQGLGLEPDTLPSAIAQLSPPAGSGFPVSDLDASYAIPESEQADLIASWAESVFLKFRRVQKSPRRWCAA